MSIPKINTKKAHVQLYRSKNGWRTRVIGGSAVAGHGKIVFHCGQGYSTKSHATKMAKTYIKLKNIWVKK